MTALTTIDRANLEEDMSKTPAQFAYFNGLCSLARRNLEIAKKDRDSEAGNLRRTSKMEAGTHGQKLTAKDLDDVVFSDPDMDKLCIDVINSEYKFLVLKGLLSSLEQKSQMLIQLSANQRAETKLYN